MSTTIHVSPDTPEALQEIADALFKCKKIVFVTGAGISTNSGIPDFRSENGLYSMMQSAFETASKMNASRESEPDEMFVEPPAKRRKIAAPSEDDDIPSYKPMFPGLMAADTTGGHTSSGGDASTRHRISDVAEAGEDTDMDQFKDQYVGPSDHLTAVPNTDETSETTLDTAEASDVKTQRPEAQATESATSTPRRKQAPPTPRRSTRSSGVNDFAYLPYDTPGPHTPREAVTEAPKLTSAKRSTRSSLGVKFAALDISVIPQKRVRKVASLPSLTAQDPPLQKPSLNGITTPQLPRILSLSGRQPPGSSPLSSPPTVASMPSSPLSSPPAVLFDPFTEHSDSTEETQKDTDTSTSSTSSSRCSSATPSSSPSEEVQGPSSQPLQAPGVGTASSLPRMQGRDLFDRSIWQDPIKTNVFYSFITSLRQKVKEVTPTPSHYFMAHLRDTGKLVRCYTQNIDLIEEKVGLSTCLEKGAGYKGRFSRQSSSSQQLQLMSQVEPSIELSEEDKMRAERAKDGGVECVFLHGSLNSLRCFSCSKLCDWDVEERENTTLSGQQPTCPHCAGAAAAREERGKRALGVGKLRPNIVLYGEEHPQGDLISPIVQHDIALCPDMLVILGTSLRVHGLKVMVKEFARAVHRKKGKVLFVNFTKPAESAWRGVIDYWIEMDCDGWVEDLRARKPEIWAPQGVLGKREREKDSLGVKKDSSAGVRKSETLVGEKRRESSGMKRNSLGGESKNESSGGDRRRVSFGLKRDNLMCEKKRDISGQKGDKNEVGEVQAAKKVPGVKEIKEIKHPAALRDHKRNVGYLVMNIVGNLHSICDVQKSAYEFVEENTRKRSRKSAPAALPSRSQAQEEQSQPEPSRSTTSTSTEGGAEPVVDDDGDARPPTAKRPRFSVPASMSMRSAILSAPTYLPTAVLSVPSCSTPKSDPTSIRDAVKTNPRKRKRKIIDGETVTLPRVKERANIKKMPVKRLEARMPTLAEGITNRRLSLGGEGILMLSPYPNGIATPTLKRGGPIKGGHGVLEKKQRVSLEGRCSPVVKGSPFPKIPLGRAEGGTPLGRVSGNMRRSYFGGSGGTGDNGGWKAWYSAGNVAFGLSDPLLGNQIQFSPPRGWETGGYGQRSPATRVSYGGGGGIGVGYTTPSGQPGLGKRKRQSEEWGPGQQLEKEAEAAAVLSGMKGHGFDA